MWHSLSASFYIIILYLFYLYHAQKDSWKKDYCKLLYIKVLMVDALTSYNLELNNYRIYLINHPGRLLNF